MDLSGASGLLRGRALAVFERAEIPGSKVELFIDDSRSFRDVVLLALDLCDGLNGSFIHFLRTTGFLHFLFVLFLNITQVVVVLHGGVLFLDDQDSTFGQGQEVSDLTVCVFQSVDGVFCFLNGSVSMIQTATDAVGKNLSHN